MGGFSPIHWILVVVVLLLLFGGRGKVSNLMGDFAKGIKAFKQGLKDDEPDHPPAPPVQPRVIEGEARPAEPVEQRDPAPKV